MFKGRVLEDVTTRIEDRSTLVSESAGFVHLRNAATQRPCRAG